MCSKKQEVSTSNSDIKKIYLPLVFILFAAIKEHRNLIPGFYTKIDHKMGIRSAQHTSCSLLVFWFTLAHLSFLGWHEKTVNFQESEKTFCMARK